MTSSLRKMIARTVCVVISRLFYLEIEFWDGRSQSKVHTDERTQAYSAQSSLAVTRPSINLGRRCLTSVNVPLSYSLGRHR